MSLPEIHKYALAGDMPGGPRNHTPQTGMECGSCSFVCPSKRPLVQSIKLAKQYVLAKRGKK